MRIGLCLVFLLTLMSCAQKLETIPHVTQYNHLWQCTSVQVHNHGGKDVKSVLSFNYSSMEFRSKKAKDGSGALTYTITYPGSKNETSSFNSGMMRLEPIINGKQWVNDEWHRVALRGGKPNRLKVLGLLSKTRTLRQVDGDDSFTELEVQKSVNGEEVKTPQELWARKRKATSATKAEETRTLLNPEQVEPGLKSWVVVCNDDWVTP